MQKDLGTSVMIFGMFVVVLYVATNRPSWLIIGATLAIVGLALLWLLFEPILSSHLAHVTGRVNAWRFAMDDKVYSSIGGSWQLVMGLFGMLLAACLVPAGVRATPTWLLSLTLTSHLLFR